MARTKDNNKRERRVKDHKHPRDIAQHGDSAGRAADADGSVVASPLVYDAALETGATGVDTVEGSFIAAPVPYRLKEDTVSLGGSLDFAGSDHAVTAYTDVLDESTGYDETAIYDTVPAYASSHEEHNDSQINVYESDEESETNSHDDRAGVYMRENSEYNGVVTSGLPVSLDEAYHMTASPDYSHLTPVHSPANLSTYAYVAVCPSSRPPKFPPVTEADGDLKAQNAILVQQLAHSNLYGNEKCLENIEQKREIAQKDAFIKQLQECNLMIAEENVKLAKQLGRRPTTMQMFGLVRQL